MKIPLTYLILSISLLAFSTRTFSARNLIVKGNLKVLAVGEGITCALKSQVNDFKKVAMIVNSQDTLYSTIDNNGEFTFDQIDETATFEIYFPYSHSNSYLNKTAYYVPKSGNEIFAQNRHSDEYSEPVLSDYTITEKGNVKTITMAYALYCFITPQYEPAGFKLMDYPLSEQAFQEIVFSKDIRLSTNETLKGFATLSPYFAYQIQGSILTPVYSGFFLKKLNLENESGSCFKGDVNATQLPCDLQNLTAEIHENLSLVPVNLNKIMLGKNLGMITLFPQTFLRITSERSFEKKEIPEPEDSDPSHHLKFNVQNLTDKFIVCVFGNVSDAFDAGIARDETPIKKNETKTIASTNFSMNNPKNYKAKIWLATFPSELFQSFTIYYGKKKIKLAVDQNWEVANEHLNYVYTLKVSL